MARRRVVEDGVERAVIARPREQFRRDPEPRGESLHDGDERPRLTRRVERLVHQIEMRIGALAADLLEPGRARQHHVREAARRVVHEQVVADDQVRPREARRDLAGIGKGREHVRAEEQQHAHLSIDEGLGDPRHLVRDVCPRRAALGRRDVRQILAVRAGAVARAEAAPGNAEVPGQRGQAPDRARSLPAVGALVHRAAAEHDHGGPGRRVAPSQGGDALRGHTGDGLPPRRRVRADVGGERVEPQRVIRHEGGVVTPFGDDHVHHRQRERRIGARPDPDHLVGLRGGLGLADVDGRDVGAAVARRREVAAGVGLAREIGAPEQDEIRVRAHVLLRIGLEHPREPEPEGAEPQQIIVGFHH
jgi:hypothetical protein